MQLFSAPTCLILLYTVGVGLAELMGNLEPNPVRRKREWIIPPTALKENKDYSHLEFIAKIQSENEVENLVYSLEGIGANKEPYNVFHVNPTNGYIQLSKRLDRELIDSYSLTGVATFQNGTLAEEKIKIIIKVLDENDNSPKFPESNPVYVKERSFEGTFVTQVNATDADEPGNPNSKIYYSIFREDPPEGMFSITPDGKIHVDKPSLDRERTDRYVLTIKGQDLNGLLTGNTGTGTVTINVLDVNDHPPTIQSTKNEVSVEENTQEKELLRIKTEDQDQRNTENWEAVYDIVKGNEAKYLSIHTDPETNEGVLMLVKSLDYENVKELELTITVKNKAPLSVGLDPGNGSSVCSVTVHVTNQHEGSYFDPEVKAIPIREGGSDININHVITRYRAINEETKQPAENVRYFKGSDPDNWLTIDPVTAEIKLNKLPDRESPFLKDGTYYVEVLCITDDMPFKTATGTVAIQVEDFNDNCPRLTSTKTRMMCINKEAIFVQAHDEDVFPNGPPFHFSIVPEGTRGKWEIEYFNDTAAILRAPQSTWAGMYEIQLLIQDEQGNACPEPQMVKVLVCTCEDGEKCGEKGGSGQPSKQMTIGTACIGLAILGLLLLLLLPLFLLFCKCGPEMNTEIPSEGESYLLNYNIEGLGENTMGPLIIATTKIGSKLGACFDSPGLGTAQARGQSFSPNNYEGFLCEEMWKLNSTDSINQFSIYDDSMEWKNRRVFDGMALPYHFLEDYITQKAQSGRTYAPDIDSTCPYQYEGQGSPTGSVGCCSLLAVDNDLHFLDDLSETKFKKLAEVCGGLTTPNEVERQASPDRKQHPISGIMGSTVSAVGPYTSAGATDESVVEHSFQQAVKENLATIRAGTHAEQTTTTTTATAEPGHMFLLRQPVYYASNTVMQPVQYMVQTPLVLTESPTANLQTRHSASDDALVSPANAPVMVLVEGAAVTDGKAAKRPLKVKNGQSKFLSGPYFEANGFQKLQRVEGRPSFERRRPQRVEIMSRKCPVSGSHSSRKTSIEPASDANGKPTNRKVVMMESN